MTDRADQADRPGPSDPIPLNPRQLAAVEHGDGPLVVLAGAGTGKTRVLTHRVVQLIRRGVPPWEILCVTFTNKAAGEMRQRLGELLGDDAQTIWVGTFHSICARFLRRYGQYVGLASGFTIYDESDQAKLIDRMLKEADLEQQISPRQILSRIGRAKDRGADPALPTGHPADSAVAFVAPLYQAALAKENAVDFSDLLLRALDLLGTDPAASVLSRKFSHVLVDEFQDTNAVQYELVRRLSCATGNLTVVGDDDQAIYAWRGAEPDNLLHFEEVNQGSTVVKLEQNYRSTKVVLRCANAVISHNGARHDKTLWTDRHVGDPAVVHRSDDDGGEGFYVAQMISQLVSSGRFRFGDVAVLYRTNQQSRVIEERLRHARIPSRVIGGTSFFDRKEVKDLLAYLRLVANPTSDLSFERVVNVPARGIGDATLGKLKIAAKNSGRSLLAAAQAAGSGEYSAVLPAPARRRLGQFAALVSQLVETTRGGSSVAQIITLAAEWSGMRAKLDEDRTSEGRDRMGHLSELASCGAEFDDQIRATQKICDAHDRAPPGARGQIDPWDDDPYRPAPMVKETGEPGGLEETGEPEATGATRELEETRATVDPADRDLSGDAELARITSFLEKLALVQPGDEEPPEDAVRLMTIHVAKGLEWPVVFVTGLEDGLFPSLREREDGDMVAAIEEERRLMYVAITRARERLFLTHARTRRVWGEIRPCDPSRFLDELPSK